MKIEKYDGFFISVRDSEKSDIYKRTRSSIFDFGLFFKYLFFITHRIRSIILVNAIPENECVKPVCLLTQNNIFPLIRCMFIE